MSKDKMKIGIVGHGPAGKAISLALDIAASNNKSLIILNDIATRKHNLLIKEYELIAEKKSKFSRVRRDFIVYKVECLVRKGEILKEVLINKDVKG